MKSTASNQNGIFAAICSFCRQSPWFPMGLVLILTNSVIWFRDPWTRAGALDTSIYLAIADAAPGLPADGSNLVFHGAQRFILPYLLGLLAKAFQTSSWEVFKIAVQLFSVGSVFAFWRCSKFCSQKTNLRLLATFIFCFHVYLFRLQISFSGFINDALFVLGFTCCLLALYEVSLGLLLVSCLSMLISKQTFFMVFFPAAIWTLVSPNWRKWSRFQLSFFWGSLLALTFSYAWWIGKLIAPFATPPSYKIMTTGIISWALEAEMPKMAFDLFDFVGRGALGLLFPLVYVICGYHGSILENFRKYWLYLFFIGGMLAQPIIAGPLVTGGSAPRLSSLCIGPLLCMGLRMWETNEKTLGTDAFRKSALLVFVASFHHMFSLIGPNANLKYVFFALYLVCAGLLALCLKRVR